MRRGCAAPVVAAWVSVVLLALCASARGGGGGGWCGGAREEREAPPGRVYGPRDAREVATRVRLACASASRRVRAFSSQTGCDGAAGANTDNTNSVAVALELRALRGAELMEDGATLLVQASATLEAAAAALAAPRVRRAMRTLAHAPPAPQRGGSLLGAALTGAHFGAGLASDGAAGGVLAVHLVGEGGVSSRVARGDPLFAAAVVSGGAMGVAVAYEFETVDAHDVELCAYRGVHWRAVAGIGTRAAMGLAHGVALRSSLRQPLAFENALVTHIFEDAPRTAAAAKRDALNRGGPPPSTCRARLLGGDLDAARSVARRHWHEAVLDADNATAAAVDLDTPASRDAVYSEYFVDIDDGGAALAAIEAVAPDLAPSLGVMELRAMGGGSKQLLSPCARSACLTIKFVWKAGVPLSALSSPEGAMSQVEAALRPLRPVPHLVGARAMPAREAARNLGVGRLELFSALQRQADPRGRFGSPQLRELLRAAAAHDEL